MSRECDGGDAPKAADAGEAVSAVRAYARLRFGTPGTDASGDGECGWLSEHEWRALRDALQRLTCMDDLEAAVQRFCRRYEESLDWADECEELYDVEETAPGLPYGWLTLLEASYERLGDTDGLCTLYAYYIVTDVSDADEDDTEGGTVARGLGHAVRYIGRLRDLCGERWPQMRARIVDTYERHCYDEPVSYGRNTTFEELLRQEGLAQEALRYCRRMRDGRHGDIVASDLLELTVRADMDAACALLTAPLHDADSSLMRDDSESGVKRIVALLSRLRDVAGAERMRLEAERLIRMYRRRPALRSALRQLIDEADAGSHGGRDVALERSE